MFTKFKLHYLIWTIVLFVILNVYSHYRTIYLHELQINFDGVLFHVRDALWLFAIGFYLSLIIYQKGFRLNGYLFAFTFVPSVLAGLYAIFYYVIPLAVSFPFLNSSYIPVVSGFTLGLSFWKRA